MKKLILTIILSTFLSEYLFSQIDTTKTKIDSLAKEIKEVKITGKKKVFERKIDRLVFNVENSIIANTGDVIDALKITPGINIKSNEILMIGKSGLSVMLDDKIINLSGEQLMSFLRTIPSNNIKSIEIITTPPAKYDAAGNSGIINIITKKTKINYWSATLRGSLLQQTYSGANFGADLYYNKDKVSFFFNNTYGENKKNITYKNNIFFTENTWFGKNDQISDNNYFSNRIGITYQISPKVSIGTQYIGNFSSFSSGSNNWIEIKKNNQLETIIQSINDIKQKPNNFSNINLFSIIKLDTLGKKINIDFDYFNNKNNNEGKVFGRNLNANFVELPNSIFSNLTINGQKVQNYSAKIDVDYPTNFGFLNFGGKIAYSKTDNNFLFYDTINGYNELNSNLSNYFQYNETIQALYFSINKNVTKKISMQVGLRLENTNTDGKSRTLNQNNKNTYLKLFPTLYISYKVSDEKTLSATYSKRINRPSFESLNPFRIVVNPYQYVEGNPFLQPSFTDNYELIYNSKNNEVKFYLNDNKSMFDQVANIDPLTNITGYTYYNFVDMIQFGIVETYTFNKITWWNSNNVITANYSKSKSNLSFTPINQEGFTAYASTNNDFTLNKKKSLFLSLGYFYVFPTKYQIYETSGYGSLNAGIKAQFFKRNLNISASINDILSSERPTITTFSNGIKQQYKNYWDNRQFRLSLTYTFGNKNIYVRDRNSSNESERNRTGN